MRIMGKTTAMITNGSLFAKVFLVMGFLASKDVFFQVRKTIIRAERIYSAMKNRLDWYGVIGLLIR